jgi:hypothetical protein
VGAGGRPQRDFKGNITLTFENAPAGLKVKSATSNTGDLTIDIAGAGFVMAN